MIDQEKLEKALKHLELQYANYQHAQDRPELTEIDREAIAESLMRPVPSPVRLDGLTPVEVAGPSWNVYSGACAECCSSQAWAVIAGIGLWK